MEQELQALLRRNIDLLARHGVEQVCKLSSSGTGFSVVGTQHRKILARR